MDSLIADVKKGDYDKALKVGGIMALSGVVSRKALSFARKAKNVPTQKPYNSEAHLSINAERLTKQLASEEQMSNPGKKAIIKGKNLKVAPELARRYGGEAKDWAKMTSESFIKNDIAFETH